MAKICEHDVQKGVSSLVQGCLARKQPPRLGSPLVPRHRATVGSHGGGVS